MLGIICRAGWFRSGPLLAIFAAFAISCGAPGTSPTPGTTVTVTAVSPASVSTLGGATITITGTGFGSDSTVTIGGVAVTSPTIASASITATAPPRTAGATTVVVTSAGKSASGNITFVAPSGLNAAPVISNLRVTGPGSKPPSPFVDLASSVTLSATVTDVETSPSTLTYAWTVGAGTITGTGASVTWALPATLAVTPAETTVTLTVTETFTENSIQHRNTSTSSLLADTHDSSKEILDKGFRFLDLFSLSTVPAATVLSDFDTSCGGYQQEFDDTNRNRLNYLELPGYQITRLPPVTFSLGGTCVYSHQDQIRTYAGDACSTFSAHWIVRALRDVPNDGVLAGETVTTDGRDFVTAVFRNSQWKLCDSQFVGVSVKTSANGSVKSVIPTPQGMVPGRIKRQQ